MDRYAFDVRLTPDTPAEEVLEAIDAARMDEVARTRGVTIALRRTPGCPASYTPPGQPGFDAVLRATRAYWGREPVLLPLLGGTLPAYVFTEVLGLPAYWLPGAQSNNRQHDVNEHLLVEFSTLETCRLEHIVGRLIALHLMQEPHALLGE